MRMTTAWATVTSQNVVLRLVVLLLAFLLAMMAVVAAKVALRDPLVIERACLTSVASMTASVHTPAEIEAFVKEALRQRFDSDATPSSDYLSIEEFKARTKEQDELGRRQMRQRLVVNTVARDGDAVTVDCDRLIAIGAVRSAFAFPLSIRVGTLTRSNSNPYGLVLTKVIPIVEGGTNERKP